MSVEMKSMRDSNLTVQLKKLDNLPLNPTSQKVSDADDAKPQGGWFSSNSLRLTKSETNYDHGGEKKMGWFGRNNSSTYFSNKRACEDDDGF
jgi:hypothetical protein